MRYSTPADFRAIADLDGANFGFHYSDEDLDEARLDVDPARFLLEEDGGRIVGVSADMPLTMSVPGGPGHEVATAGITWVSVDVTHRRRGILRRLVEQQLRDRAADGCAAAILTASEGAIYARFGFGVAEQAIEATVDRQRARLSDQVREHGVRRVSTDEARELFPPLHERWRREVPGAIARTGDRWTLHLLDRPHHRRGGSGLFHLRHDDGFVSYRIDMDWNSGLPQHTCRVLEYAPVTAAAHAALWQVLLADDLVGSIVVRRLPEDDPLPLLLDNPRHVRTTSRADGLWLRPLDVAALLSARTYPIDVDVVLDVRDPLLGDGRYRLDGGPDGATCTRTDASADVTLDVGALGAVSLGGTRLASLARVGRVAGDERLVARLDRALLADRAPCVGTVF